MLQADCAPNACGFCGGSQRFAAVDGNLDRLLDQHMFSRCGSSFHDREMCSRGRQDQDKVEVRSCQQILLPVENRCVPLAGERQPSLLRRGKSADDPDAAFGFQFTQGQDVWLQRHSQSD